MTEHEEKVFDSKVDRYFTEHRDCPTGRNFLAWQLGDHAGNVKRNYDMGICRTFPKSPGSRMCGACPHGGCDMRVDA